MDYYRNDVDWSLIPEHMHECVRRYVMRGQLGGGFMTSLFAGASLMEVAGRADTDNLAALQGWAMFLYNYVPSSCVGTPDRVREWHETGGILGQQAAREKQAQPA